MYTHVRFPKAAALLAITIALATANCGYNSIQSSDEEVKAAWSEVLNQYKRRADLVPNLIKVVERFAKQEKDVFQGVADARSRVGSIQATPELINDEAAFQKFIAAQGQMQGALSRLMAVAENYPQLKSDRAFTDLQAQLEGTENRIAVARGRYIKSVQDYNVLVRQFPNNMTARVFGYTTKPNFTVENEQEISKPPEVDFGTDKPKEPKSESK